MNTNQLENVYRQVEAAMGQAQRLSWRGIAASDLHEWMPGWPEKQVAEALEALYSMGRVARVGRGFPRTYRLTTRTQREAFALKYGLRPRGEISVSEHTDLVFEEIEKAVAKAYRNLRRGVFPRDVQPLLPYNDRAEGSLRRDMIQMYAMGRLVRVGGHGARQGYRLPTRIERLCYSLNGGMWPHGTEFVVSWAN